MLPYTALFSKFNGRNNSSLEGRLLKLVRFLDECALDPLASESHRFIKTHCCIVTSCPSTFKLTACLWQIRIKVLCKSKDRLFFTVFRRHIFFFQCLTA